MTRLTWDSGKYESGVSHGVFYMENSPGEIWPGLIEVQDNTPYFDERKTVIDGITVRRGRLGDSFLGSLSAYTYPDGFFESINPFRPKPFGFTYRVEMSEGYKIHILYNVRVHGEIIEFNQADDLSIYQSSISTSPMMLPEGGFSSHMIVDSTVAYPEAISDLEDVLYGSDTSDSSLPSPIDIFEIFEENSILRVIDNGDGTATVIGPDEAMTMLDANTWQITWPSVTQLTPNKYRIHSL